MKYYNASKVNNFVDSFLIEAAGGVIARSPSTRSNVGRPDPTATEDIPAFSPAPAFRQAPAFQQAPAFKPIPVSSPRTPDEIEAVTSGYTSQEELLKQLKKRYPAIALTFGNQGESPRFIQPYQPGMFKPAEAPVDQAQGAASTAEETPKQAANLPIVDNSRSDEVRTPRHVEGVPDSVPETPRSQFSFNPTRSVREAGQTVSKLGNILVDKPWLLPIVAAGLYAPVGAGHLAKWGTDELITGLGGGETGSSDFWRRPRLYYDPEKPAFGNKPIDTFVNPREMVTSAADWAALEGTANVLGQLATRNAIAGLGLRSALASGLAGGALIPVALGLGAETGKWIGEKSGYHKDLEDLKLFELEKEQEEASKGRLPDEFPDTEELKQLAQMEREIKEKGLDDPDTAALRAGSVLDLFFGFPGDTGNEDARLLAHRDALKKKIMKRPKASSEQEEMERQKKLWDIRAQRAAQARKARINTERQENLDNMSDEDFKKHFDAQLKKMVF